jgi:hypothetical protein
MPQFVDANRQLVIELYVRDLNRSISFYLRAPLPRQTRPENEPFPLTLWPVLAKITAARGLPKTLAR